MGSSLDSRRPFLLQFLHTKVSQHKVYDGVECPSLKARVGKTSGVGKTRRSQLNGMPGANKLVQYT
jgi:hypothetical protein